MSRAGNVLINTGGGQVSATSSIFGGTGNQLNTEGATLSVQAAEPKPWVPDVLELLKVLSTRLAESGDLSEQVREDLNEDLEGAIKSLDRPEPNTNRALARLESFKRVLDALGGGATSVACLGGLVVQALGFFG